MRILVACEESQTVTLALRARGHEAYSCDLVPCSGGAPDWHIQGDALVEAYSGGYDMMIAHPPCTYLCSAGCRWMRPEYAERFPGRQQQRRHAIEFFVKLFYAPIPRIAIENPVGVMSTFFRKPDQYVHPYHFGDPHSKKTGLWLRGLPLLAPTNTVKPAVHTYANGRLGPTWHVGTLRLPPAERTRARSKTFPGLAEAMAIQWTDTLNQ